jgi:hypothetical protein
MGFEPKIPVFERVKTVGARNLPGGKGRLACKADNLTAMCEPIV